MRHRKLQTVAVIWGTVFGALTLTACSSAPATGSIVVVDGTLRVLGSDCAGASAYLAFHAGAELTIKDAQGEPVVTTVLTPGVAIAADTRDYGTAKREPSYCAFEFDAAPLIEGEHYQYALGGETMGRFVHEQTESGPAPIAHPALGNPSLALKGSAQ